MKKVLVACGAAVATSAVVAKKIEKIMEDHGIDGVTYQARASAVNEKIKAIHPDVVVCTCQLDEALEIPVMNGRSFLTGIHLDKTADALIALLKQ